MLLATGSILAAMLPVGVQVGSARPAAAVDAPELAYAVVPLYQEGVAVTPDGAVVAVPTGTRPAYLDGSRVLDPALTNFDAILDGGDAVHGTREAARLAQVQRDWLASGRIPGVGGPYEDLARSALLDLHTLLLPGGAMVAGWEDRWRYVWPRDAAFVAVAFARTGHVDSALQVLDFLARTQHDDGGFEARYLPDGSGPPDDRTPQTDGQGWAMWAAGLVLDELPAGPTRTAVAMRLAPLVQRAVDGTTTLLTQTGLPPRHRTTGSATRTSSRSAPSLRSSRGSSRRRRCSPWPATPSAPTSRARRRWPRARRRSGRSAATGSPGTPTARTVTPPRRSS
ncbi:hypothetical protein CPER28S_02345 [Cellulomonas persica]